MDRNQIASAALSRRQFLFTAATAAGGFAIGFGALPGWADAATVTAQPWDDNSHTPHEIDAWIAIDPDDSVLIRYQRSEMGQGSMTAVPMMLNEELQADWSKVRIEYASANRNIRENRVYGDMFSNGSRSIKFSREIVQQVGASARERLIAAAAQRWHVPVSECSAADSVITHKPSGRKLRYGELAAVAAKIRLKQEPRIKTPGEYTFIGRPMPRIDVPLKVDGSAIFGIDARVPGMVFAAIMQCPVPGGKLKDVDESPLSGAPGIVGVVKLPGAVAVAATGSFWRARQALAKLQPEWDFGPAANTDTAQFLRDYRTALDDGKVVTARNEGNVDQALPGAATTLEAMYETPYLSHSPMEPMNATVDLRPDRLDIWVGTQDALAETERAAKAAGLDPRQVYLHNCFVGGGFGRRDVADEVVQAIAIAKAVQKPVKLIWTREEDTRNDKFRPMAVTRFKAGLGSDGMPSAWSIRTVAGSVPLAAGLKLPPNGVDFVAVAGLATNPYRIEHTRVECVVKDTHLPVWWWRAPGANQNVFAIESFVDEMAAASGQDPYQLRRRLLAGKPDYLKVLDAVAEKSNWGTPLPKGRGRGIAICEDTGSLCAQVAEVTVRSSGEVKVDRVIAVLDTRHMVNPLTLAEQIEGAIIFGLSAALYGKIDVKNGAPVQGNFDTYRMVRFAQAPKIEVYLMPSGGPQWGGAGEAGVPPIAGAVANAIFAASGKRIRSLPIMDHDLSSDLG
jgi:isoquinoline 1-oxidoreductase beta subunit